MDSNSRYHLINQLWWVARTCLREMHSFLTYLYLPIFIVISFYSRPFCLTYGNSLKQQHGHTRVSIKPSFIYQVRIMCCNCHISFHFVIWRNNIIIIWILEFDIVAFFCIYADTSDGNNFKNQNREKSIIFLLTMNI